MSFTIPIGSPLLMTLGKISRSLQPGDGESPTDLLLPELQELSYPARSPENAFTPFIDARQKADRPVTVTQPSAE
jgi:hypothetical protein